MGIFGDFFTREAGQRRRAWLDKKDQTLSDILRYYAPPLAPKVESAAGLLGMMSDGQDYADTVTAGNKLMQSKGLLDAAANFAEFAAPAAAVMIPGVTNRLAQGLTDTGADMVRMARDESGAFAGVGAKTANLDALARAQKMASDGKSRESIWKDTGWFKGVDGKWRFEIDDSGAVNDIREAASEIEPGSRVPLAGVIEHRDLFAAYPELEDVPTHLMPKDYFESIAPGAYGGVTKSGELRFRDDILDTGRPLHEIQHLVQRIEGFARGGSPVEMGFENYQRLAGETEARNVELRALLDAKQRRQNPPWLTQDVPDGMQIPDWLKQ